MRNRVPFAAAIALIAIALLPLKTPAVPSVHDCWPAFAPDGRWIAFQRSQGTSMDIYVVTVNGRVLRRLTHNAPGVLAMSPVWLPDGRHVLYTTTDATSEYPSGSFYEISSQGAAPKALAPAGARGRSVSPDGSTLLFLTRAWEVAQLDLKTGGITVLNRPSRGTWDTEAAWSPDGKQIAFGCNLSPAATVGRSDICIMNAGGTNRRVLAHESGAAEWVTWSPDGTQVAFQRDGNSYTTGAIVVHDLRTGAERVISTNTGYALNETPAWSPDGTWIALQVKTARGYRIALMRPDGSAFRLLAAE